MHSFRLLAAVVLVTCSAVASGQDGDVAKQKKMAAENMSRAGVSTPAVVETDSLLVYSSLPEDKTKPIADAAQKAFDAAQKALKFADKDKLWAGKLTVYLLADRKELNAFVRLVENRKPEVDDVRSVRVSGAEPYAMAGTQAGARSPESALRDNATAAVVIALLDQKAGANTGAFELPPWLRSGFGKAIAYRLDPRAYDAFRARIRPLFSRTRVGLFQAADIWDGKTGRDYELLAVSLAEYLVFGADEGKLEKFLGGFRPADNMPQPTTANALEAANWRPESLDYAWKNWVLKQR